jgi:crossover junction endodeoxyribonuclease RuvC
MGTYYIGIDIGISGGICAIGADGFVEVFDMPTEKIRKNGKTKNQVSPSGVHNILKDFEGQNCCIEAVSARPGQGVTSMFSFGRALGVVEGVAASCGLAVTFVGPKVWQKAVKLEGENLKDSSRARARQLLPAVEELFSRKKDHGRSDAALIAYYSMVFGASA